MRFRLRTVTNRKTTTAVSDHGYASGFTVTPDEGMTTARFEVTVTSEGKIIGTLRRHGGQTMTVLETSFHEPARTPEVPA